MDESVGTKLGVGGLTAPRATGMGAAPGQISAGLTWRTAPIKDVAFAISPQVALARHWGLPWAPFEQGIIANMTDPNATVGPFSFQGTNSRLSIVSVVDAIILHMDMPNLNAGNALKPFIDFFFTRQSGIQCNMTIDGSPKYLVIPDFLPIDSAVALVNEQWPAGWALGYAQAPKMQFTPSVTLSAPPVTVTVTFRMWQPAQALKMIAMTDARAVEILAEDGVLTAQEAARFNYL